MTRSVKILTTPRLLPIKCTAVFSYGSKQPTAENPLLYPHNTARLKAQHTNSASPTHETFLFIPSSRLQTPQTGFQTDWALSWTYVTTNRTDPNRMLSSPPSSLSHTHTWLSRFHTYINLILKISMKIELWNKLCERLDCGAVKEVYRRWYVSSVSCYRPTTHRPQEVMILGGGGRWGLLILPNLYVRIKGRNGCQEVFLWWSEGLPGCFALSNRDFLAL